MNGYVWFTLGKLCGIRTDLVRRDDNWKSWEFNEMIEAIRKWTERNPTERFERSDRQFKEQHQIEDIMQTHQNTKTRECIYCGSKDHKAIACNTMQDIDDSGQQTHQRWINVEKTFIKVVSTLIFGWKWKLSQRTFIDVVSTLTKCWNDVDRIMSIQRRWTNVVLMFKFGWKWKLSRRMFNDVVSTLTNQRWYSYVDSMLMTHCCFNVDIRLKRKVESTHVHRCWENSIETTLSIFVVLRFTRKWLNNKTKLSFQV